MKLYTKGGDDGWTGLYGGSRISKKSLRIRAIGDVDELNSAIGLARVQAADDAIDPLLARIQNWLFDIGSELACPPEGKLSVSGLQASASAALEKSIDEQWSALPPLKAFILPGGSELAARLHFARCVCRRVERSVLELDADEAVRDDVKVFLNRLSDWLFATARTANKVRNVKDNEWSRSEDL